MRSLAVVVVGLSGACGPSVAGTAGSETSTTESGSVSGTTSGSGMTDMTGAGPDSTETDSPMATTSTSPGDTGTVEDDGSTFIMRHDGGSDGGRCDLLSQNCPRGFKCMPVEGPSGVWEYRSCLPVVDDPAQIGEACTVLGGPYSGIDDCDVGLICWKADEQQIGICENMCQGFYDNPTCASPDEVCVFGYFGSVWLCVTPCDPLAQTQQCEAGDGCYAAFSAWGCFLEESLFGGAHNDPCYLNGNSNTCDPGFVCRAPSYFSDCVGNTGCCTPVCDLDDPSSDTICAELDPAQTCIPWLDWVDTPPEGYAHVGICGIPQ